NRLAVSRRFLDRPASHAVSVADYFLAASRRLYSWSKSRCDAITAKISPLPRQRRMPSLTLNRSRAKVSVHFPRIPWPIFRAQPLKNTANAAHRKQRGEEHMATSPAKRPAKAAKTNSRPAASVKGGKIIYFFGKSRCDGKGEMKALLGGKGANL